MNIYYDFPAVMFPVVKARCLFVSGSDEVRGRTAQLFQRIIIISTARRWAHLLLCGIRTDHRVRQTN